MDYKFAIFDLDGTLLDSMYYWRVIAENVLEKNGVHVPEAMAREKRYLFTHIAFEQMKKELGVTKNIEITEKDYYDVLVPAYESVVMPKPRVCEFLEYLNENGVTCCIATATERFAFTPALYRLGMEKYFKFYITTSEVGKSKNYPDIFDKALSLSGGTKENTVIFEDALYSIKTAVSNGYRVYAVEDEYARDDRDEIKKLCEKYITNYETLLKLRR